MSFNLFRKPEIDWDAAYSAGNYDGHQDDFQWGRYALIGNLIGRSPARNVLDVGCGFGTLRGFLPKSFAYTGLDISSVVIAQASADRTGSERFIDCDIEQWEPDGAYDVVVCCEVLYYLKDLTGTLSRMSGALGRGGLMIASFYNHRSSTANRRAFDETLQFFETDSFHLTHHLSVSTEHPTRHTWSIVVWQVAN
jgi:trans-aconitate methyltransferase